MRIEKTHSIQIDAVANSAVRPGLPAEEKRMQDAALKDKDAALKDKDAAVSANAEDGPKYDFRRMEFSIHEKTGDIIVKVYDAETNEIVREIPPEKIKDLVANILERAGLLMDKRA
jgi:uncharacterized FlaG/YvyC family protein